jgi:hypothetical protein
MNCSKWIGVLGGVVLVLGATAYGQNGPGLDQDGIAGAIGKKGPSDGRGLQGHFPSL